jgi:hypothetical protein
VTILFSANVSTADRSRCERYAQSAIAHQQINQSMGCGLTDSGWDDDHRHHFDWCMHGENSAPTNLDRQRGTRVSALNQCKPAASTCEAYARGAALDNAENLYLGCSLTGGRWSSDYQLHLKWCQHGENSVGPATRESRERKTALDRCRQGAGEADIGPETAEEWPAGGIGKREFPLSKGTAVKEGKLEAVGTIPGCTATLVTQDTVVTAAHCVCTNNQRRTCSNRATFTLHSVVPANGVNRRNINISGDVHVHPNFDGRNGVVCGANNPDIAVIHLDTPAFRAAKVQPIPVEEHFRVPKKDEELTLVGFGLTGKGKVYGTVPNTFKECRDPSKGKMKLPLPVAQIGRAALFFDKKDEHTCGGDSGGPALNSRGRVVATASCSDRSRSSHYKPLYSRYDWIFGLRKRAENNCSWNDVEKAGIKSHQRGGSWCQGGGLLTALDLDRDASMSTTDSPIVGSARCCDAGKTLSSCSWSPVSTSHEKGSAWCSQGSFLTAIDLDGGSSAYDYPIVGGARCCKASKLWGKCLWVELGASRSHGAWSSWCPAGTYATALDLDVERGVDAGDSPIVGRARCCDLRD